MPLRRDDDTTSTDLRIVEDERAREAGERARDAESPQEASAHRRRADKAAYLRDKLADAERADARADA
ncbi:MAG TPA: hypothetical protein VFT50_15230 [Baekduia sp.]|nr:hypothetical protein [Baekduia sp.]